MELLVRLLIEALLDLRPTQFEVLGHLGQLLGLQHLSLLLCFRQLALSGVQRLALAGGRGLWATGLALDLDGRPGQVLGDLPHVPLVRLRGERNRVELEVGVRSHRLSMFLLRTRVYNCQGGF